MARNYHNVSVRFNDDDMKKVQELQDKYSRFSYGRVTLADVIRNAVTDTHLREFAELEEVEEVKETEKQEEKQD